MKTTGSAAQAHCVPEAAAFRAAGADRYAAQAARAILAIHARGEVALRNALLRDVLQAESWEPAALERHAAHIHVAESTHGTALTTAIGSGRLRSQAAQIIVRLPIATGL